MYVARLIGRGLPGIIALAGCHKAPEPITFAAAAPWNAAYMTMTRQGIDLAAAEANSAGGVDGRLIKIRWVDDDASGVKAVPIARALVADRSVLAVIGHESSAAMLAAARIYDGQLVAVSPSATSPDLTGLSSWVFRVVPSDSTNGQTLARFTQTIGAKRVAILYENDAYGRGLAHSFRRNVVGSVVTSDPIAATASSYEPYIAYLKQLQPDLVFVAGLGASGLGLMREAKRQDLRASFLGSEGWAGIERDTAAAEGAYIGAPFAADDPRPAVQHFVTEFEARFHTVPREDAALGYDVTRLLIQAAREGLATRLGVRDYIASLSTERPFAGVTGSIRFLPNGDPVGQKFVMTRVHRGAYQITGTY